MKKTGHWTNNMLVRQKKRGALLGCLVVFYLSFPGLAHAYLDPGTGSMLLSAVVSIVSAVYFLIRGSWHFFRSLFYRLIGKAKVYDKSSIVFYSEGAAYWNTFKPVLEGLERRGVASLYMTSDPNDPGLSFAGQHTSVQYIGTGNAAYMTLNLLEADVCAMTTPGLDVLQIRRSKGVKHYAHIIHAVTDMAIYKLYSFDYYDSILCSGPHQERSIRTLEKLRGTPAKELLHSGCPYLDVLAARLAAEGNNTPDPRCVLIAPTWGANGLLARFGVDLIRPLAEAGYSVIIRPHPQSLKVEAALVESIRADLARFPNVGWDTQADGFASLQAAAVLISDLSGIVFDYAFVFERPVITVRFEPDLRGLEGNDLPYPAWELTVLDTIGRRIAPEDIASLPTIVHEAATNPDFVATVRALRSESVYNYATAGDLIAEQLIGRVDRIGSE